MSFEGFVIVGAVPSFYEKLLQLLADLYARPLRKISDAKELPNGYWVVVTTIQLPVYPDKLVLHLKDLPAPLISGSSDNEEIVLYTKTYNLTNVAKLSEKYRVHLLQEDRKERIPREDFILNLMEKEKYVIFHSNDLMNPLLYEALIFNLPIFIVDERSSLQGPRWLIDFWKSSRKWGTFINSISEIELVKRGNYQPRSLIGELLLTSNLPSLTSSPSSTPSSSSIDKDCVVIVNCLNPPPTPLSYTKCRSIYSVPVRWSQLLNSINSVRKFLPEAQIIVAEVGNIPQEYLAQQKSIPYVIWRNLGSHQLIAKQRDSLYKGLTEILVLRELFPEWKKYRRFFKLSGRYEITKPPPALSNKYLFSRIRKPRSVSTVYYCVPANLYTHFVDILDRHIAEYDNNSIEDLMVKHISDQLIDWYDKYRRSLGSRGHISVDGRLVTA